jgi:hydrogenase nickel incorporation protein HypA/HybF
MHELSIALSILELAEEESERRGDVQVTAIHVRIGPLSGVVASALQGAYELAREDSPLSQARLVIQEMPLVIHCAFCDADGPAVSLQRLCCVRCGEPTPEVVSGSELEIAGLEILEAELEI